MRRWGSFVVSMVITLSALVADTTPVQQSQEAALVANNNRFAFDLYAQLKSKQGNLFFSPYSISSALAMTAMGAAGETKSEMDKVLHFNSDSAILASSFSSLNKQLTTSHASQDALPQLLLANGLWLQKGFSVLPAFTSTLSKDFQTAVNYADFKQDPDSARKAINQWVLEKTHNKIKDLFPDNSLDSNTRLVIASAIYMQAQWTKLFKKSMTTKKTFHLTKESKVDVEMMTQTSDYPLLVNETFALIEIPYAVEEEQDPALTLLILLPKDIEGISAIENSGIGNRLQEWMKLMESQHVELTLPKFKIEEKMSLKEILQTMGLTQAFNEKADFSGISGNKNLSIDKFLHKAYVSVDENGTEAAAATAVSIALTSVHVTTTPYHFLADHPFFFIIIDKKTDAILFMGRLSKP